MKRTNTASEDMINEVKELRNKGVNEFFCNYIDRNGKWYKAVTKKTAQGISAYANKMLEAHNFEGRVSVWYIENVKYEPKFEAEFKDLCEYRA